MEWTCEQAQGVVDAALKRAAIDAEFRRLALRDARAAVGQMTGKPLPEASAFVYWGGMGTM
jgi:hypothetical protein